MVGGQSTTDAERGKGAPARQLAPAQPLGSVIWLSVLALLRRVPQVSFLPAHLIGVGLRPEHAPDFARRPAEQPSDAGPPGRG